MLPNTDRAVVPVVGMALLIGFTVGLVGLVGAGATDTVQDFGHDAGATVTFEEDAAEADLDVTIVDVDDEVDVIEARYEDGPTTITDEPQTGDMGTIRDAEPGERVNIIAIDENADTENLVGTYSMTAA